MRGRDKHYRILELAQPQRIRRHYLLTEGSAELGRIDFMKAFGSLAEVECGGRRYTMKRAGFLRPHIIIRGAELGEDLAVLRMEWGLGNRGTLELMNGHSFTLRGPTFRDKSWAFVLPEGEMAVFRLRFKALAVSGTCRLSYDRREIDPLLLCLIGWYFIILALQEQQSIALAGSGGS